MLPATQTLYFEDLSIGLSETYAKEVKSSDVIGFAEISGDRNPIHLSEHFAAQTPFKGRIAHGLYTASLISAVIGTRLPGPGAIYMKQTLNFRAPVRIGDIVTARVEVLELSEKGNRVRLACTCSVDDLLVLEGEALVKMVEGRIDLMICGHTHRYAVVAPQAGVHDYPMVIGGGPKAGKAVVIRVDTTKDKLQVTMTRDDGQIVGAYTIQRH